MTREYRSKKFLVHKAQADLKVIDYLVKHGADINAANQNDETLLHRAVVVKRQTVSRLFNTCSKTGQMSISLITRPNTA